MAGMTKISETDAIRQVIAEGGAMDYIDVVDAVRKKFGIKVSSALVEKVHAKLRKEAKNEIQPRIRLELGQAEPAYAEKVEGAGGDDVAHALRFVRSVNGLQNAKRALAELEAMMRQLKD
jgi:hypothetical protein